MLAASVLMGKISTDLFVLIVVGLSPKRGSLAPIFSIGLWNYICIVAVLIAHWHLKEME